MSIEVILPKVDMDMASGKISKWHVKNGDVVKKGAPIFEIETDKAAMEIESPGDGVIRDIAVPEGEAAPTGSVVAMIYDPNEAPATAKPASAPEAPRAPLIAPPAMPAPVTAAKNGAVRATPLARRLARSNGVDLSVLSGSGPQGRIVADDVRKLAEKPKSQAVPAPQEAAANHYALGSYEAVPVDAMRRTIAQRLTLSKQTVPHFYLSLNCDLENLLAARARLNDSAPNSADRTPTRKISLNDFIIKAMALALQQVPDANATWANDIILKHRASDIGVAVAIPGGLFTPVIRDAEKKTLTAISVEMKDLAERARARKLLPSEYKGGATAVSNLGMYGIEEFTAIINPPHATILAVGAATQRNTVHQGAAAIRTQMACTLSCDHRAVDGALGAELIGAFKMLIENPVMMMV
jgi:pyruvate dehydrogenase E2 component (dihydrolipoamide acetyltransferase)